ncbi:hypothetical protein FHETE_5110 [Fusarium heterosporum]|uniref:Uncharacterized protein n=1 Tax=Fusarium heterosporum TaxID=42747 RepID=A0A8H5WSU6_FUSHE|nr:hypothetical protein FHETE_5110 [Fusarium heterosporum]
MASRLKNAIKKRASRLFHRDKDGTAHEDSGSLPSSNRNSLNAPSRTSQSRHRKSLSALSRSSKTDPHHGSEIPQTQAHSSTAEQHADDLRAHPAVQPLETDLTPRTPGLERPRPTFVSGDGIDSYDNGRTTGNEGPSMTSHLATQQHEAAQENVQPATSQSKRSSRSADVEDLEGRMSRMTVFHTPNELPEIDIDPLTPFELVDGVPPDQAKLSPLAIDQDGPEHASTHIKPLSQESDVNLESNVSQEANINHNLEAIHPRDAEFERINQEVSASANGESSFHLENSLNFDRTIHNQEPVVEEHIRPHVHTIYEPKRTLSIHHHEHRTLIQPIKDPNPTILPDQHWLQDDKTGEIYRIPAELGKKLM